VGFVQEFLRGSVPVLLGLSIPVLCTLLWFAHIHDSGALLYTSFTYPARVVSELPQQDRSGTLLLSLQWFAGNFAPLLALGFVGASLALSSCVDVFVINLVLWIIAGFVVILLQKYSWWEYHFFLLLVPLGILSVKALDECWGKLAQGLTVSRRQRWLVVVFLLLLFSPVLDSWAMLGFRLAHHRFALSPDDRLRFQARLNPVYATVSKEVGFLLRSDSLRGDIFVFGDPRYYYLAHRNQAVAINGAMPELLLPQQWRELTAELAAAEPPYIYVAADQVDFQESRAPEILQFINEKYSILHSNDVGTWYILRASNANPSNANQR
jgi:hypothetical protein